jgi:hypothetical protein
MFRTFLGSLVSSLLFLSFSANAYIGSISAATGEAGKAAVEASESPWGNPASLAYITGYHFAAGFGASHQNTNGRSQDLAVSLTDNMKDTIVPSSLSYVQNTTRPEGATEDISQKSFKLSMGNFMRENFSFGLGINYEDDRTTVDRYTQTNVQTGILWSPHRDFGIAVVLDNLLTPPTDIPEYFQLRQTTGIGTSYNFKRFLRVKLDVTSASNNSFGKPLIGAGMETYLNKWLILRWGLQRNNDLAANLYTAGMGFVGPKFGVHYAYENSPQNESLTRHSVDLAVPIW